MDKYNDNLLDEKFNNLHEKLDVYFDAQNKLLLSIDEQSKKTNGRVGRLESWRNFQSGALAVLSVVVLPVMGILGWMIIELSQQVAVLKSAIDI